MSRTFKTDPTWVKIFKPSKPSVVREYHDHRKTACDICEIGKRDPFWWRRKWKSQSCGYDVSYYAYYGGFYVRPPRGRSYRQEHEGRMRADWRKQRQDMLKLSFEEIEDYDYKAHQHRHSALWELY